MALEGEGSGRKGRVAFAVGPAANVSFWPIAPPAGRQSRLQAATHGEPAETARLTSRAGTSSELGEFAAMPRLGVNIDHVATLRQTRGGREPDPVWAAVLAELGGADVITIHLREDRRHIQDRDVRLLGETVQVRLNLELALEPAIVAIALET